MIDSAIHNVAFSLARSLTILNIQNLKKPEIEKCATGSMEGFSEVTTQSGEFSDPIKKGSTANATHSILASEIQEFSVQSKFIWCLISFSCLLNSTLTFSSCAFKTSKLSDIPLFFMFCRAASISCDSLCSKGNMPSVFPVIKATACLHRTLAGQPHEIFTCLESTVTTTKYRSNLLLLSAENLYSISFFSLYEFITDSFYQEPVLSSRDFNSLRIMRFIQAARDSSPSLCWAFSIRSRSSGSSRNWNGGLPRLSFLCVDTSITPDVMCLCVMTRYMHTIKKATPRCAGTLPRRLTKPLIEVTVMAETQSTQTRPKFQYRFLAIDRANRKATPCRLTVEAYTEHEARLILCAHFILSLAARLPAQEVSRA